jgi:serine phosphatase RsbU (regulator of sigma subunit)
VIFVQKSYSQNIIEIGKDFEKQKIGKNIMILEDRNKNISFEKAKSDSFKRFYKNYNKDIPFFGYQNRAYWIKFTVKNNSSKPISEYLLIDYPLLYKISFYQARKDSFEIQRSGDGFAFNDRKLKTRNNLFEFETEKDSAKTFYCRIESDGDVVTMPISVISKNSYVEKSSKNQIGIGIYYGILILIIIINFFYFVNLHDKIYILYIMYVVLIGLFQFTREGLAYQYFWGNSPYWNNVTVVLFSLMSIMAYLNLLRILLETKKNFPVFNKIILTLLIVVPLMMIPLFLPSYYRFLIFFGNYIAALTILLAFIIILISLKRKMFFAKYFLAALFFLISGSTMLVLKNYGFGGIFQWEHGLKIGSALEFIILTYGFTVKFRKELSESQIQAINQYIEINKLKEQETEKLELSVRERTQEIYQQKQELKEKAKNLENTNRILTDKNEEINQQKEELIAQRNEIEFQKNLLTQQTKQLTDSIQYAKRIQKAALVHDSHVLENEEFEFFTFYQARDIVGGDFYRIYSSEKYNIFVSADCTGHGVPGGYLSMLGIAILNEIVSKNEINNPAEALNVLRENIKSILHQNDLDAESRDGMDIAVCFVERENLKMQYAGAHLPVYIFRNEAGINKFTELRGDKMPIGFLRREKPFSNQEFQLHPDDKMYLFSDGFIDQVGGGPEPLKFKTVRFRNMLEEISYLPWNQQKILVEEIFNHWKSTHDQVDDVLVMGIHFI